LQWPTYSHFTKAVRRGGFGWRANLTGAATESFADSHVVLPTFACMIRIKISNNFPLDALPDLFWADAAKRKRSATSADS
jgi:hypothetical protein